MRKALIILIVLVGAVLGAVKALDLYDACLEFGRMWETPGVRPHEEPVLVNEAGTVPFSGGEAVFRATPEADGSTGHRKGGLTCIASVWQAPLSLFECRGSQNSCTVTRL